MCSSDLAARHAIPVVGAERTGIVFGESVAVALAVRGAHEGGDDLERPLADTSGLTPEVGETQVDVEFEEVDAAGRAAHVKEPRYASGRTDVATITLAVMTKSLHIGPARVPSRESPEAAIALLLERGYSACELDFEGTFWMSYEFAERFGELARDAGIALSVHAPIAGFMGHAERGKKLNMAVGMLDHSAGIAKVAGAKVVVFHPGFLLGRTRAEAIDSVCEQLGELRERLEGKDRGVPFGIEVMGRVRELGSLDDVVEIAGRLGWVRPVIDFAHMHATSDGQYLTVEPFVEALTKADAVLEPGAPFHIHFSDIQFANRNETKHLPYGGGTLRAEPLKAALAQFPRPATLISESPDEESSQRIKAILEG